MTVIVGVPKSSVVGNELYSYSVDPSTGVLSQVSVINPHGYPGSINIDSQSKFVYVYELYDSEQLRVALMNIGPESALTFDRTYNFPEVSGNYGLSAALLSVNGKYLYFTNDELASITTLQVSSVTGALKYVTTTPDGTVGINFPIGLATSKNGSFVFTADDFHYGNMGIFSASRDGSLNSLGTFPMYSNGQTEWIAAKSF
jgi:6-phosphogluconolactonase (cycloisomerase 2 family)